MIVSLWSKFVLVAFSIYSSSISSISMPVVNLKENLRQSPSWYDINWKEMHYQNRKSGRDRDDWPSSSSAADERASLSSYAAAQTICGVSGKTWTE